MVLRFSFLPLRAPERSIVCKLHLKHAPLLGLGSHLGRAEEPPSLLPASLPPGPAEAGGGRGAATRSPRSSRKLRVARRPGTTRRRPVYSGKARVGVGLG